VRVPTVVIELYRVDCPDCGVKAEKIEALPSKGLILAPGQIAYFPLVDPVDPWRPLPTPGTHQLLVARFPSHP
jgi:hypothetical protein